MIRFVARLLPPYAIQSVRVTVAWRKRRIRRIRVEYVKPRLIRRLIESVKW